MGAGVSLSLSSNGSPIGGLLVVSFPFARENGFSGRSNLPYFCAGVCSSMWKVEDVGSTHRADLLDIALSGLCPSQSKVIGYVFIVWSVGHGHGRSCVGLGTGMTTRVRYGSLERGVRKCIPKKGPVCASFADTESVDDDCAGKARCAKCKSADAGVLRKGSLRSLIADAEPVGAGVAGKGTNPDFYLASRLDAITGFDLPNLADAFASISLGCATPSTIPSRSEVGSRSSHIRVSPSFPSGRRDLKIGNGTDVSAVIVFGNVVDGGAYSVLGSMPLPTSSDYFGMKMKQGLHMIPLDGFGRSFTVADAIIPKSNYNVRPPLPPLTRSGKLKSVRFTFRPVTPVIDVSLVRIPGVFCRRFAFVWTHSTDFVWIWGACCRTNTLRFFRIRDPVSGQFEMSVENGRRTIPHNTEICSSSFSMIDICRERFDHQAFRSSSGSYFYRVLLRRTPFRSDGGRAQFRSEHNGFGYPRKAIPKTGVLDADKCVWVCRNMRDGD